MAICVSDECTGHWNPGKQVDAKIGPFQTILTTFLVDNVKCSNFNSIMKKWLYMYNSRLLCFPHKVVNVMRSFTWLDPQEIAQSCVKCYLMLGSLYFTCQMMNPSLA